MNLNDYIIVSDFDGTITLEDSNARLVEVLGNEANAQIELDFIAGVMGNREAMDEHFKKMSISLDDYYGFLDEYIELDEDFDVFLEKVREQGIPLLIVSGGYNQGIKHVLGEDRLKDITVVANDLAGEKTLSPRFATENPKCKRAAGACGNCKMDFIKDVRNKYSKKIVYIGDGITDFCVASYVDVLFAKDFLAAHCQEKQVPFIPFGRFRDVTKYLFCNEA